MAVNISKVFRDTKLRNVSKNARLTYIYFCTHPDINIVGVLQPTIKVCTIELSLSIDEFRNSVKELIDINKLYFKEENGIMYFIIPDHFSSRNTQSESIKEKINNAFDSLPTKVVDLLKKLYISKKKTRKKFCKPTPKEVNEYSLSIGYVVDGNEFVRYYDTVSNDFGYIDEWVDSRGTKILDWKGKLRSVWSKKAKKLKTFTDAPEGFEMFHILNEKGDVIQPTGWRNGKPYNKDMVNDVLLKNHFNKINQS